MCIDEMPQPTIHHELEEVVQAFFKLFFG